MALSNRKQHKRRMTGSHTIDMYWPKISVFIVYGMKQSNISMKHGGKFYLAWLKAAVLHFPKLN